ncbi:MAG: CopG family ribbon-helix-helix protein [Thermodesulfobacteriota bacterium]
MSGTTLISARVPEEVAQRLEALASETHRSKSYLAAQAIEEFVDLQEWQVAAIKEGMAAAEKGKVKSHAQALAILNGWGKGKNAKN